MSEEDAQHSYVEMEVLIDSARVLSSSFPSIGVVLTGNELEILRNVLNYATRRRTFVGVYHDNYYLVADDDDWLDIESIVAILEEKLMGNDNTVWGYYDRLFTREDHTALAAGSWQQDHDVVPAGEVWVVTSVNLWSNFTGALTIVTAPMPTIDTGVTPPTVLTASTWHVTAPLQLILKAGDHIRVYWSGVVITERMLSDVIGYKMKVST